VEAVVPVDTDMGAHERRKRAGKRSVATSLGDIAARRHHSVRTEHADKLFKRPRGARLDTSYEDEMR
jgi:hypothetical protein